MPLCRISAIAACATIATLASLASADVRSDDFSSPARDTTQWNEIESYRDTVALRDKVGISQDGGMVRINGLGGKGGGAAFTSTYKIDWNDGFRARFRVEADSFTATLPTQSAVVGLSFGFDPTFSVTRGHRNAIVVEIESTPLGRTVQIAFRKGALTLAASPKVPLAAGWHDFEFEFTTDGPDNTASMSLYAHGDMTPIASVPVFPGPTGFDAKPVTAAIYGLARGTPRFAASFDDFQFEGDIYGDSDDASWDDLDSHSDGPGNDSLESIDAFQLRSAFYTAVYESVWAAETIIFAEVCDGSIAFVFRESASTVRVVKASVVDQSLVESFTRPARPDERLALASVWNGASVSGADAVDYLLHVEEGTSFVKGMLNLKAVPARWDVRMVLPTRATADFTVPADGNTGGDGVTCLAPMLFSGGIINAYDAYPAGQGRIIAVSMVAGALEAVFVNPAAANSVRVVRINPRTGASLGAITRAATASESWAIPFAPQYGIAEAAWLVSMDYAGAPLMSWRIVDRGDGTAGSHTQLKLDSGEIIDDFR